MYQIDRRGIVASSTYDGNVLLHSHVHGATIKTLVTFVALEYFLNNQSISLFIEAITYATLTVINSNFV